MKATFPAAVLCALAVTLASCGGGSSSSGLFGGIISAQQNYEEKSDKLTGSMNEIGVLPAENLGTSAVVKAGTPVDLNGCIAVDKELEGATTFRLSIDLSKAPYTSRGLK